MDETEFVVPRRPCRKCGTSKRYASNGHCVECRKERDRGRDRRTMRNKAEARLRFDFGYDLSGMSRDERDYLIGKHFPYMRQHLGDWWASADSIF